MRKAAAAASHKPSQQRPPANGAQPSLNGAAPRKTRVVKRRGRGRLDDSDDEVEREVLSDDSLHADETDSDSDSAGEDDDEPVRDLSPHPLAPPTPESPHRRPSAPNAKSRQAPPHRASSSPPAAANDWGAPANDWSVGAEAAQNDWSAPAESSTAAGGWGAAGDNADDWGTAATNWMTGDVPVVDFNDFNAPPSPSGSSPPPARSHWEEKRAQDRDARQAYLQKLNSDPSFVPVVGQFYQHDDRLMDKGLRRLNNWNNRRAQRGAGFVARGRGRGGFGTASSAASQADDSEVPPADRATWKHDGYEELARHDERRFNGNGNRGGFVRGSGRGGFAGRGGRGRGGFARGGFPHVQSTITYVNSPAVRSVASSAPSLPLSERRVWFHMKPERSWTKQFDAFLFQDWSLRPRPGQGPGVRIKLPGTSEPALIRLPVGTSPAPDKDPAASPQPRAPREELAIVVKLKPDPPPPAPMVSAPNPSQLRPTVAPYRPPPARQSTGDGNWVWRAPPPPTAEMQRMQQQQRQQQQLMTTSSPPVENAGVPPPPPYPMEMQVPPPPMQPQPQPHPVMTAFVPPYQSTPSPVFPSPYGYPAPLPYPPAPNGYAPDGRPVYYAPPPPHPHHSPHPSMSMPMYGPPPPPPQMMHGHAHHGSMQFVPAPPPPAEYYPSPPPQPPIMDTPFFKPPRPSARVEIRAPTDGTPGKVHKPSNLRTSSTPDVQQQEQQQQQQQRAPAPVEYVPQQPQQQQAYYYYAQPPPQHDGYGYAYGAPPMQYDMYAPAPDGTVYFQ